MVANEDSIERYAERLSDGSYEWYVKASKKSRRYHRTTEIMQLVGSASISVLAVIFSGNTVIPAIIGALIVIVTGLRSLFHWQENYLRFSKAREDVEAERRRYRTEMSPYCDSATRGQRLVEAITMIENGEMAGWLDVAGRRTSTIIEQKSAAGEIPTKGNNSS
ncbi:DUF4231 domain-containing protein [Nocardia sp. NPDC006630]|uniref:DUF4231 domain-containing protein n=1 Tax=Nocardia sp. NPDC006630 TaxID=3157181 RepID=UPI0033ADC678